MSGRALVVGGGRFVGLTMVRRLLAVGYRVDVLNRGLTLDPHRLPAGVRHLAADRADEVAVARVLGRGAYDAVFDTSGYRPEEVRSVLSRVEAGHYVYVSSLMVYAGMGSSAPEVGPLAEDDEAVTPYYGDGGVGRFYAGLKRACEVELLEQDRIPVTVLRPCGIYGAGDYVYRHDYFFDRIVRQRPILMPDSHCDRRVHLTSVDGLVDVALRTVASPGSAHRVFNVADISPVTCGELADLCLRVAGGKAGTVVYAADLVAQVSPDGSDRARFPFGAEPGFSLDGRRVRDELGWPGTDLAEGTAAVYRDYRERSARGELPEPDDRLDDALLRHVSLASLLTWR